LRVLHLVFVVVIIIVVVVVFVGAVHPLPAHGLANHFRHGCVEAPPPRRAGAIHDALGCWTKCKKTLTGRCIRIQR